MTSWSGTETGVARIAITAAVACLAATGCPKGSGGKGKPKTERVRVRSFTETSPVRLIAIAPPYAFTASKSGLDRWEISTGQGLHLTADDGLPHDRVVAMAPDTARGWVWIATDGGITRYNVNSATFSEVPAPPSVLGFDSFQGIALEGSGDGGLWIGHRKGLFYTNHSGQWTNTPVTEHVTALRRSRDGVLWIGTKRGLIGRQPDGETYRYGEQQGCDLASVRFIVRAPDGGPIVVGADGSGKQRIILFVDDSCATYRASPDERWLQAAQRASEVVVMTSRGLYALRTPKKRGRRLKRAGMRLVPLKVGTEKPVRSPYVLRALDHLRLPAGTRVLAVADDEVLVGTRNLGTARLITGRRRGRTRWLRRGELVEGASSLSVACARGDDCYVAMAAPRSWRFDGERFTPLESGEARVLAVARSPKGAVFGLRRGDEDKHLVLARIRDGVWVHVSEMTIETPGGRPELTFARFSPSGILWVGLHYRDDGGELRPYGVALVDVELGAIAYHHASLDERETAQGVLPIPVNVIEVSFLDENETWLASTEGAARIRGQRVDVFTEGEGLLSEFLRGVSCSNGGMVFVASGQGVGIYDGESWNWPPALRWPVNDLEIARDSRLWMATDRGVAVFDGARVRRLDVRRGLLENQIEDVVIDHVGRIWVRGSQGLTVVTP